MAFRDILSIFSQGIANVERVRFLAFGLTEICKLFSMTWKPLANAVGSELINVMFETKLDRLPSKHLWFHEFVAICSISLLVARFDKQARIVRKKTYREANTLRLQATFYSSL